MELNEAIRRLAQQRTKETLNHIKGAIFPLSEKTLELIILSAMLDGAALASSQFPNVEHIFISINEAERPESSPYSNPNSG